MLWKIGHKRSDFTLSSKVQKTSPRKTGSPCPPSVIDMKPDVCLFVCLFFRFIHTVIYTCEHRGSFHLCSSECPTDSNATDWSSVIKFRFNVLGSLCLLFRRANILKCYTIRTFMDQEHDVLGSLCPQKLISQKPYKMSWRAFGVSVLADILCKRTEGPYLLFLLFFLV